MVKKIYILGFVFILLASIVSAQSGFDNDNWIVGGTLGNAYSRSFDGINFSIISPDPATAVRRVGYSEADDLWIVVGDTGMMEGSQDGVTWSSISNTFGTDRIRGIDYSEADDLWVAVGSNGKLATSPNGQTWTSRTSSYGTDDIYSVYYSEEQDLWVSGGQYGKLATSPDGITWTQRTSGFSSLSFRYVLDIEYSDLDNLWVAGSNGESITTSPDGTTWTKRTTNLPTVVNTVSHSDKLDLWIAAGNGGNYATSSDGITWASGNIAGISTNIVGSDYSEDLGLWVLAWDNRNISTSTDGTTWVNRPLSLNSLDGTDILVRDVYANITAHNNYNGSMINTFNVTFSNGAQSETIQTTNGTIQWQKNSVINYTITGDGYYPQTYTDTKLTDDIELELLQTNITFQFRTLVDNQTISGTQIDIEDIGNGFGTSTTTGSITFNPSANELLNFNISGDRLVPVTESFTFSELETGTYYIYLTSAFNVTFYDEATLGLFDFTGVNESKVEFFCTDLRTIEFLNIVTPLSTFNDSCVWSKMKVTLTYDGVIQDTYYRTIRFDDLADPDDIKMYLINLNNDTSILNTFILYDIFNEYELKSLIIQKITTAGVVYIHSEFADIRDAVSAYLIQNDQYIFTVTSSNLPDKLFGTYIADTAGDFTMRLFDLDLSSQQIYTSTGVAYTTFLDGSIIRSAYNDTTVQGVVTSGTFTIRNGSETGNILYTASSSNTAANFAYAIPASLVNASLYTTLYISVTEGTDISHSLVLQQNTDIIQPSDFETPDFLKWTLFLMLVAFSLTATIKSQDVISILMVALGGFLNYIGWVAIGYPVLSVGALLALINLFMGDDK